MCCGGCTGGVKARGCGARSGDGGSFGVDDGAEDPCAGSGVDSASFHSPS